MRLGLLLPILGFLDAGLAWPTDHYRYLGKPGTDAYLGHISYCESQTGGPNPSVLRGEAGNEEVATLNAPIAAGDVVVTPPGRRCEVQFDTGTVLRLGADTSVRIETLLAPALTTKNRLTNLVIERGQVYVLYRHYDKHEMFQLLTQRAAVKMLDSAVVAVEQAADGSTALEVARGSAQVLYGARAEKTRRHKAAARERLVVGRDDVLRRVAAGVLRGEFGSWNQWLNDHFPELHPGKSLLPKPLEHQPRVIQEFSERWSGPWGEWVWMDLYGYVWRPHRNADAGWEPYADGHWITAHEFLFWVPDEPWGWVPHHFGFWTWDAKQGWVWVPGAIFAPAWVVGDVCKGYLAWRPWSRRDIGRVHASLCWSDPLPSESPEPPAEVAAAPPAPPPGQPPPGEPPTPDPPRRRRPEIDRPIAMALAPAEAGNSEAPGIAKGRDAHVRSGDLARPVADERPERGAQRDEADGGARPQPAREVRFLDWNPDVREAARVGGTINYSSHDNLVHCDGCRTEISRDDDRADSSSSSDASGSGSESGSDASSSQGSFGIDSGERGDRETPERPDKPQNR